MRPKTHQLGIMPEFTTAAPADYFGAQHGSLSRAVMTEARRAGVVGVTARELSDTLGHSLKSVAGRITELTGQGCLRVTEARRGGRVYIAVTGKDERYA